MCRIAAFSTAGGAGKATTAMNLTAAIAERGKRVLAVDLGPGSWLLRAFGQTRNHALLDAAKRHRPLAESVRPTPFAGAFPLSAGVADDVEQQAVDQLRNRFDDALFNAAIPRSTGLIEARARCTPVAAHHTDEIEALENQRPRMLDDGAAARSSVPEAEIEPPPTQRSLRNWKPSARLDAGLFAELYGAASELAFAGATVSSLVEEALHSCLPRLRAHHNEGRTFAPRGPRSPARRPQTRTAVEPAKPTFDEAPPTPPANPVDPLGGNTRSR